MCVRRREDTVRPATRDPSAGDCPNDRCSIIHPALCVCTWRHVTRCCCILHPASRRLQDDASEDPLTAARAGATGAAELYWKQKMVPSIKEVFATCLSSNALQVPDRHGAARTMVFECGSGNRPSCAGRRPTVAQPSMLMLANPIVSRHAQTHMTPYNF